MAARIVKLRALAQNSSGSTLVRRRCIMPDDRHIVAYNPQYHVKLHAKPGPGPSLLILPCAQIGCKLHVRERQRAGGAQKEGGPRPHKEAPHGKSQTGISPEFRATWVSRRKKKKGHFQPFSAYFPVFGAKKGRRKSCAQPWYARKSGYSLAPKSFPAPPPHTSARFVGGEFVATPWEGYRSNSKSPTQA